MINKHVNFLFFFLNISIISCAQIKDTFTPLAPGDIRLYGHLEHDIENSLLHWNMGILPYSYFARIFKDGRKFFAQGEMWGKAVRSGSLFYRYTQNPVLKQILRQSVYELISFQKSNGCISASDISKQPDGPGGDIWERSYVLLGLEAYYEWVSPDSEVLSAMIAEANCTIDQIGLPPKIDILALGWSPNHIESSTILLPIMKLYEITGDSQYLNFAKYIVDRGGAKGYNLIDQAYHNVLPYRMGGTYPKAYEMTLFFEGLIEYYKVTHSLRIKRAIVNYYTNVMNHEITIIGNGGGDFPYHPDVMGEAWDNTAYEQSNPNIKRMMETCAGVTWMEFCGRMFSVFDIPSSMDLMEKYIYNGLIGAMRPDGTGFSYVNLLNGIKTIIHGWGGLCNGVYCTCCNLNGPLGLAYIPYYSVMQFDSGIVLNFYNSMTAQFRTPSGNNATIKVISNYPISDEITVVLGLSEEERFDIMIRIPSFSKNNTLLINHSEINVVPGSYKNISRVWHNNDTIFLKLDLSCHVVYDSTFFYQALIKGPIVLTRDEHLDKNYNVPNRILSYHGLVKLIPIIPSNSSIRMEYLVPTQSGIFFPVVDYASANSWDGSHIQTWIPITK